MTIFGMNPFSCLPRALRHSVAQWALLWVCMLAGPMAWADDRNDHHRAREAVQSGQVLPLATVLERLAPEHPGQVLEVELESRDGQWFYEIKLLKADGRLVKLLLDARTAAVLRSRLRDGERDGRRPSR